MGSIPGPVLSIRIDAASLTSSLSGAMQSVRDQTRQAAAASAEEWKRAAAQIRATVAQGIAGDKEVVAQRQQLVSILNRELDLLRSRNDLTNKQVSSVRAMTLELERQQSFLKNTGGLTAGTGAFLGQLQSIGAQLSSRLVGSIGANFFGVTGGSLLGEITSKALSGGSGTGGIAGAAAGGGIFAGLKTSLSGIAEAVGPTTLAIGGATAAIAAQALVVSSVTKGMIEYAQATRNVAAETGLTVVQVQQFKELAKITGVDADGLANSFGRLQVQLGKFVLGNKDADKATENFVKVLDRFNISITKPSGSLRPIDQIMGEFAQSLSNIPDSATRTAVAMDAMGIRGRVLVQVMDNARASGLTLKQALDKVAGTALPESEINQLLKEKEAWDKIVVAIDTATIHLKGWIATHPKELTIPGYGLYAGARDLLNPYLNPNAPGPVKGTPTADTAADLIGKYAAAGNAELLKQAQILKDGGALQFQLAEKEKEYTEAIKDNRGADALNLQEEIKSLEKILKQHQDILDAMKAMASEHEKVNEHLKLMNQLLYPGARVINGVVVSNANEAPNISLGLPAGAGLNLGGLIGPAGSLPPDVLDKIKSVNDDRYNLTASAEQKIRDEYTKTFEYFKFIESQYPQFSKQIEDTLVTLKANETKQIEDLGDGLSKKMKEQAGKLFDDLISGRTKGLGKRLGEDLLKIALEPLKKQFEEQFAKIFDPLINGKPSVGGGASGSGLGGWLGSLGGIFGANRPGGTPGWFPGSIGLGGGGGGQHVGQVGIQTPQTNVQSGTVIIAGAPAPLGGGPGASNFGNFFGATGLLGGFGNFFGNLNPFGNAFGPSSVGTAIGGGGTGGSSGLSAIFKAIGPVASGAVMLGAGIASDNPEMIAMGAAGIANVGVAAAAKAGMISMQSAQGLSTALPGFALVGAGIARGGVSGGLEDLAGGTMAGAGIGFMVGGPAGALVGAAIGAIAGGITGIINGVFGGGAKTFENQVKTDMFRQQYNAPGSENFSFAENGSIASTLQTGFNQIGGSFTKYALLANTPFWANAIKGPLTWQQAVLLHQESGLINPNAPFEGFPTINPYTGQGPLGNLPGRNRVPSVVQVHLNLPGFIDANSASVALAPHAQLLARMVSDQIHSSSSGFGFAARRANNLP